MEILKIPPFKLDFQSSFHRVKHIESSLMRLPTSPFNPLFIERRRRRPGFARAGKNFQSSFHRDIMTGELGLKKVMNFQSSFHRVGLFEVVQMLLVLAFNPLFIELFISFYLRQVRLLPFNPLFIEGCKE